ncbi:hypothetical protein, partial [Nisaea sp.]|uniref:hypothetical protein n=1 Tax=Nisaea sp. TaxID=2024842 RepID=UPI00329A32AD
MALLPVSTEGALAAPIIPLGSEFLLAGDGVAALRLFQLLLGNADELHLTLYPPRPIAEDPLYNGATLPALKRLCPETDRAVRRSPRSAR